MTQSTVTKAKIEQTLNRIIKKANVEPRPYQYRLAKQTLERWLIDGLQSVFLVSATGSGKTVTGLLIAKAMEHLTGARTGWTAHRSNLRAQVVAENLKTKIGADLTTISIFDNDPPTGFDLLVDDEGHHSACNSAIHLHNVIKPKYVLGLSATDWRSDNVKLCYQSTIKDAGIGRLIEDGYLSQYDHYTIKTWSPLDVANLYLNDKDRWGQSLMFFHTLAQCEEAHQRLRSQGIRSDLVTGSTDREPQLAAFAQGNTDVIVNCMVLIEGFDAPNLKSVFCRPSCKSVTIQMAGRAFRKYPTIPVKQIVQCDRTRWPFVRTAKPRTQYQQHEDGGWRSLEVNQNIDRVGCKMLVALANIDVKMPNYFKDKKPARRRPNRGNQNN